MSKLTDNKILKIKSKFAERALQFGYERGAEALAFKEGFFLGVEEVFTELKGETQK